MTMFLENSSSEVERVLQSANYYPVVQEESACTCECGGVGIERKQGERERRKMWQC